MKGKERDVRALRALPSRSLAARSAELSCTKEGGRSVTLAWVWRKSRRHPGRKLADQKRRITSRFGLLVIAGEKG